MKLPELPFLKKKDASEYLLILLLRREKANAVIVQKSGNNLSVLNQHEEFFSTDLESAPDTEWLDILDMAISRAEEKLPSEIQTHKTIFGLPNSWVEDKQIKKEYLTKLKAASDALEMSPIGFIEIPEAICHLLAESEGAPVSALVTEIGNKSVSISLARAGRIIDTKSAPIRDTAVLAVDSLLKEFDSVDVLPSRMIVYNGKDSEELSQAFLNHHWSKSIPFLHMPKITILPGGFDVQAIIKGAAEQLGASVSAQFVQSFAKPTHIQTPDRTSTEETESVTTPHLNADLSADTPESFGFVVGKDIATLSENEKPVIPQETETTSKEKISTIHLEDDKDPVINRQSDNLKEPEFAAEPSQIRRSEHENISDVSINDDLEGDELPQSNKGLRLPHLSLPGLRGVKRIFSGGNSRVNNKLLLIGPAVLIILIGLTVVYSMTAKATIAVSVQPEIAEQEEDVIFSPTSPNDFSDNIIQAKTTTLKLSGTVSTPATGTKEEGEKAKGTITVFNSSTGKKELAEGTVIRTGNGLEFVLDKSVIIASASGDIFSGTQSGTAKVPVTAVDVGKESNVPSNTTFTTTDSQVAAKNEEAFSGGSSREITVVSEDDITKLIKELPETLRQKAEDQMNEKLSKNETLLTVDTSDFKPMAKDFNATEGEEAETVTLNTVVEFKGIYYDNEDLIEFTKTVLKNEFSQDQTLDDSGIRNTLSDIKRNDDDEFEAVLSIEADLLPKIDKDKLREELAGKSFDVVNSRFDRLPQVSKTNISIFPPIPFLSNSLPKNPDKIEIIVTTDD